MVDWLLMLCHRLRRCPSIEPASAHRRVISQPAATVINVPRSDIQVSNVSSQLTRVVSVMLRVSVSGIEFRILYMKGSVILFISPSSGGSPGLV